MPVSRKPWYVVDVYYQTIGGETRCTRSEPIRDQAQAMRTAAEYRETGHRADVIPVPAPPPKKAEGGGAATKTGSHD